MSKFKIWNWQTSIQSSYYIGKYTYYKIYPTTYADRHLMHRKAQKYFLKMLTNTSLSRIWWEMPKVSNTSYTKTYYHYERNITIIT